VHSVGVRQVDPTNLHWLIDDEAQVFFGADSYRLTTHFSLFAFRTDLFGFPHSISISLFDPMPIFALVVRLLSRLLPAPFQYDGLYLALCFVLQGVMGFALMREVLGPERPATVAVASLLLVMTPAFVVRTYGHVALSSHWVILATLANYMRSERKRALLWATSLGIIIIGAGINVYISLMSLSVIVASAFSNILRERGRTRTLSVIFVVVSIAINVAAFGFFGYITASDWPILPTNDFGRYSANLLTFLSPGSNALLFRTQAIDPGQQGEGFGYLGLGLLLLSVITSARKPSDIWRVACRLTPLVTVGVGLFFFATLDRIRLGDITLLTVPIPDMIRGPIMSVRGNGRFVWVLLYLVPIITVGALARSTKPRALFVILAIATGLQAVEVIPQINGLRQAHEMKSVEYEAASRLHFSPTVRDFIVLPPWQCGGQLPTPGPQVPGHGMSQATFQGCVSLMNGLRSNSQYTARTPVRTRTPWCDPDIIQRLGDLRNDTVYYFSPDAYEQVAPAQRSDHWCYPLENGVLCRPDVGKREQPVPSTGLSTGDNVFPTSHVPQR
jgi:Family of unknown function (DUF6311)